MSAAEGQELAALTTHTLESMQTEDSFTLFFKLVNGFRGTEPPVLPC